jgi:serine/threonine protein kinase
MSPERFRQIRNVFEAALERAPAERSVFVVEAAQSDPDLEAQVKRMLEAHGSTVTFLDGSVTAPAELRTDPRRMEGRKLGNYEILREIGRGGMGTVYLARRFDGLFQHHVAIKIVTPEFSAHELVERFRHERAILASLEHPNIARLYDGGSTEEGWPYFVMEYVEGKPIDQWCDDHKLNVSERVRLFRTVCDAVHYALQRRVIHRDLKPGNILVTESGTVKLLDFGIAKLVRAEGDQETATITRFGTRLMTPEYASPEQIRAEPVTPLTDLYSLGVILYELVTGRRPYRLKSRIFHEIVRVVCEEAPTRPSSVVGQIDERPGAEGKIITIAPGLLSQSREGTPSDLKRRLSGDLDCILLKALEKDPRRRYRSVDQFSMDLERHLNGEPVLVARSGRLSTFTRALSKYRLNILLVLALLVGIFTGGIRVDGRGIAVVAGMATLLGLWYVMTDRKLGARISEDMHAEGGFLVVVCVIALGLVVQLGVYFFPAWTGRQVATLVLTCGAAIGALYLFLLLCAWTFRAQWAGKLIVSIRISDRRLWVTLAVIAGNSLSFVREVQSGLHHPGADWYFASSFLALLGLSLIYSRMVLPYLEVRDRGLLHHGRLISWLNIERFEWESSDLPGELVVISLRPLKSVLRLHISRLFSIFPPPRIRVPAEHQEELETILNRHLSEWPQSLEL